MENETKYGFDDVLYRVGFCPLNQDLFVEKVGTPESIKILPGKSGGVDVVAIYEFKNGHGYEWLLFPTMEKAIEYILFYKGETIGVDINKIKIKQSFLNSIPNATKFKTKLNFYRRKNRQIPDVIEVDQEWYLVDGYISYLIAKMFHHNKVEVRMVT